MKRTIEIDFIGVIETKRTESHIELPDSHNLIMYVNRQYLSSSSANNFCSSVFVHALAVLLFGRHSKDLLTNN